jgi:hypothetical protein
MPNLDIMSTDVVVVPPPSVQVGTTATSSPPSLTSSNDYHSQQQQQQQQELMKSAIDMEMEKYELLMEMSTLTDTFANLESMYISKIDQLIEKNNLLEVKLQQSVTIMEENNSILRQQLRALELELSELAYSSRKVMPLLPAITPTTTTDAFSIETPPLYFVPKPPPNVPPASFHKRSGGVRKVLQLRIRKMGQILNMFNPVDNLSLWGEN